MVLVWTWYECFMNKFRKTSNNDNKCRVFSQEIRFEYIFSVPVSFEKLINGKISRYESLHLKKGTCRDSHYVVCVSGGKNCLFFRKIWCFVFLKHVLRFALLSYYRRLVKGRVAPQTRMVFLLKLSWCTSQKRKEKYVLE